MEAAAATGATEGMAPAVADASVSEAPVSAAPPATTSVGNGDATVGTEAYAPEGSADSTATASVGEVTSADAAAADSTAVPTSTVEVTPVTNTPSVGSVEPAEPLQQHATASTPATTSTSSNEPSKPNVPYGADSSNSYGGQPSYAAMYGAGQADVAPPGVGNVPDAGRSGSRSREATANDDANISAKIFVGALSWATTEDKLRDHFSRYGDVVDAVVMRNRQTNTPRGFGFVRFSAHQAVDEVLKHDHLIDERKVDVKRALTRDEAPPAVGKVTGGPTGGPARSRVTDPTKLFVGGLSQDIDADRLRHHFSQFGQLLDAVVMTDRRTRRSRGFGFVKFANPEAASQALAAPREMEGRQIELMYAQPREDRFRGPPPVARQPPMPYAYGSYDAMANQPYAGSYGAPTADPYGYYGQGYAPQAPAMPAPGQQEAAPYAYPEYQQDYGGYQDYSASYGADYAAYYGGAGSYGYGGGPQDPYAAGGYGAGGTAPPAAPYGAPDARGAGGPAAYGDYGGRRYDRGQRPY